MSKKSLSWIRSKKQKQQMSSEALAAYLVLQLEHLIAMRECAARLMARDQRGRDFFPRGETVFVSFASREDGLKDVVAAYTKLPRQPKVAAPAHTKTATKNSSATLPLFEHYKE